MGFTEVKAQKALLKTANAGVSPINWLADHGDDADIDAPIAEAFEVKTAEEGARRRRRRRRAARS